MGTLGEEGGRSRHECGSSRSEEEGGKKHSGNVGEQKPGEPGAAGVAGIPCGSWLEGCQGRLWRFSVLPTGKHSVSCFFFERMALRVETSHEQQILLFLILNIR